MILKIFHFVFFVQATFVRTWNTLSGIALSMQPNGERIECLKNIHIKQKLQISNRGESTSLWFCLKMNLATECLAKHFDILQKVWIEIVQIIFTNMK